MTGSCLCRAEREVAAQTATVEEMRAEIARLRKELDELKDLVERMRRQTTVYR